MLYLELDKMYPASPDDTSFQHSNNTKLNFDSGSKRLIEPYDVLCYPTRFAVLGSLILDPIHFLVPYTWYLLLITSTSGSYPMSLNIAK